MMCNLQIISSILLILLLVTNSCSSSYVNKNNDLVRDLNEIESLKDCLTSAGVDNEKIVHRDSGKKYTELNWQYNTLYGYIKPLAYVVATRASDVRNAVICCQLLKVRVVARSGGHSYAKYGFGDTFSLIVDLSKLNKISVDAKQMTSEIGAGARLGLIYYTLWKEGNFIIPAGICPTVGIAGLALGGGWGYFSRQFGLLSDNVIEMEMVDAKGNLLLINKSTNKDLFWALRGGGGGSYGIVTKFKFRIYSEPTSVANGAIDFSFNDFSLFFKAWQSLITSPLPNNIVTLITIRKSKILMIIAAFDFSSGDGGTTSTSNITTLLQSFSFPRALNTSIKIQPYSDFMISSAQHYSRTLLTHPSQVANMTKHLDVGWTKVKSIYVDKLLRKDDIFKLETLLKEYLEWTFLNIELKGGAINNIPRNETAFVHRGQTLYNFQLKVFSPEGEEPNWKGNSAMNTFFEESKDLFDHQESYQNYMDPDLKNYLQRYHGTNLEKLIQVKRKVDPKNVFHHPQSIPINFD